MRQVARRAAAGFSLLEVAVALAVLGLLAALAVTGLTQLSRRQRESGAVRELLLTAMQARQQARTTRQPVRLALHAQEREGRTVHLLRWERLGCAEEDDRWGTTCPSAACQQDVCGEGGCTGCPAVGQWVEVPPTLNLSEVDGLCWLGGSAGPRVRSAGTDCDPAGALPPAGGLGLRRAGAQDTRLLQVLTVDGLTGQPRLVDCASVQADATLCAEG